MAETTPTAAGDAVQQPRPLTGLFKHARLAILGYCVASGLTIVGMLAGAGAMHAIMAGSDVPYGVLTSIDRTNQIFAIAYLATFLWSIVLICRFTYRAMNNLRLSGEDTDMSPGWAVGWYFIPFAMLWMPYKGMSEIWDRSNLRAGRDVSGKHLGWWWAFWVAGSLLSNLSIRLFGFMGGSTVSELAASYWMDAASNALLMVSGLLLLRVLTEVTGAQDGDPEG